MLLTIKNDQNSIVIALKSDGNTRKRIIIIRPNYRKYYAKGNTLIII